VKEHISSKNTAVRHLSELVFHFKELLSDDPDLNWDLPLKIDGDGMDHLALVLDGQEIVFRLVYELKPNINWVGSLDWALSEQCLLVVPKLSRRLLEACKKRRLSVIDLNGRAWIRRKGVLVDRHSLPGRSFNYEQEPRNIFVGKSVRIVRCLLTDRKRVWTQKEIVGRTGASSGLVSRIVQYLIHQGYVEKITPREFRVSDFRELLFTWVRSDHFAKRNHTVRYAGFIGSHGELAMKLRDWAVHHGVSIAHTHWLAAWLRHPYTEPVVTSAYVSRLPDEATLKILGLRQVDEGGKLWLHVPDDEGVFMEVRECREMSLASDAQIYLDLQQTGLRGPDAAAALLEWEGFCKP